MKKLVISMLIITLILILVMSFTIVSSKGNYVRIQAYTNSHTKAICNYQKVIKMNPITGAAVQFSVDWKDPRDEKDREKLC